MHKKQEFIRDAKYSKKILNEIYKNTSGKCDYIGEWHSHPDNSPISLLDKISL